MKRESRRKHNPVEAKSEEAATIASMLAPLEEQEGAEGTSFPGGTGELKLPRDLMEEGKQGEGLGLEPVVIFILVFVLGFIAFIAYLISVEPPK